jgi:phosphoenolpyruvate carboxykinase (GTP)
MRVLRWIIERCDGTAQAREAAIGYLPRAADLDTRGLQLAPGALDELLNVDHALWRTEFEGLAAYFSEFGARIPLALKDELEDSLARVGGP